LGNTTDHIAAHPRCQTSSGFLRPAGGSFLVEHWKFQWSHGNYCRTQVSNFFCNEISIFNRDKRF